MTPEQLLNAWRAMSIEQRAQVADHLVQYGVAILDPDGRVCDPTKVQTKPRTRGTHVTMTLRTGRADCAPLPKRVTG